ncbi:hypothetical protein ASD26_21900 [Streptomyces sp. Root1319]|nr:hypothetical protein ASD26_21900 [Streptomyces sp. Root1319]
MTSISTFGTSGRPGGSRLRWRDWLMAMRSEYRRALSRARAARRDRSSASSRISWRKWSSDGFPSVSMPITRFLATSGSTTVSPPTAAAVASVVRAATPMLRGASLPSVRVDTCRAARWPAAAGAGQIRAPGAGTGSGGSMEDSSAFRPSMRSSSSCRT